VPPGSLRFGAGDSRSSAARRMMPGSPWAWAAQIHAPAKLTSRPRKVWQPVRRCERDAASINGFGYRRQMGAGVRRQQGAGPGLRAGAGARRGPCGHRRAGARSAGAHGRRTVSTRGPVRAGAGGGRGHHDGGRSGCGVCRARRPRRQLRHRGHQRRRPAARRLSRLGPRRLDQGGRRQHADAHRADQGHGGRHGRAGLRAHRQHHLERGEGADRHPGPVQRRAQRPDRLCGRRGAQQASRPKA
jgi:hypothetical protein